MDKVDAGRKASSLGFRWVDLAVLQKSFNFNVTSDDFFYPHARKFRKTAKHDSKGLAALIVNYRVHELQKCQNFFISESSVFVSIQLALGKKCLIILATHKLFYINKTIHFNVYSFFST